MSSDPRAGARPKAPKGSVKAARERALAGLPRESPPPPTLPIPRPTGSPKLLGISRPTAMPQWPLATGSGKNTPEQGRNSPADVAQGGSPGGSRQAPPRPNRPSEVPSILDGSKIQDHIPSFQYNQDHSSQTLSQDSSQSRDWDPNFLVSPEPNTPATGLSGTSASSRPSTTSSFGSIPDFPVPAIPAPPPQPQARRSLGPPPSARRGVSSYYSQHSVVAPIPEESYDQHSRQHGSYASSHAIPRSWNERPSEYYMTAYSEEDEDEVDGRESREFRNAGPEDNTGLVRKASLGRQYKPSLTTVGSSSTLGQDARDDQALNVGAAGALAAAAGAALSSPALSVKSSARSRQEMLTSDVYVEPMPGDMRGTSARVTPKTSGSNTPKNGMADPRVRQILGGLEKSGALTSVEESSAQDVRRPPRLDIDAVREAQSRGSMTSLPDLIKRATKLASNLDKGRTASRLGMRDMFNTSDPNMLARVQAANAAEKGRHSSISNILSSFPAPALTPTQERDAYGSYENSNRELMTPMSPYKEKGGRGARPCCGMRLWVLMLLLLVLVIVVSAAIIIPIVLIVLPRSNTPQPAVDLSNCASSNPCHNGGTAVVSNNQCQCVCSNKFTGSTCSSADDGQCQAQDMGSFKGATVGNKLPGVLSSAAGFQVTLNNTAILATLAASNISCSSENALVTVGGSLSRRRGLEALGVMKVHAARVAPPDAVTSNGIVLASSAVAAIPTAATVSGTGAPPAPTQSAGVSSKDQDLAGVAILWVLQQSLDLDTAALAQSSLLMNFEKNSPSATVDLGGGVTVDFDKQQIEANGTAING